MTNPDHFKVDFENDRVRVLEYRDHPGHRTTAHDHSDSVMNTSVGLGGGCTRRV